MRNYFFLIGLFFSVVSLAGPEEHYNNQVCYYTEPSPSFLKNQVVPKICLESLDISMLSKTISIYSYFQSELFSGIILKSLEEKGMGKFYFQASNILSEKSDPNCEESEWVELHISGIVDSNGHGNIEDLNVSIVQTSMSDSEPDHQKMEVIRYLRN